MGHSKHLFVLFTTFVFSLTIAACATGDGSGADFSGNQTVETLGSTAGSTRTVAGGSTITITGDDSIDGTLVIQSGGATLIFEGDATFNGTLQGSNTDPSPSVSALKAQDNGDDEDVEPDNLTIVAQQNLTMGENFNLDTDTAVKITDDQSSLPTNDEADTEAETDDGTGNVIIPLPDDDDSSSDSSSLIVEQAAEPQTQITPTQAGRNWNLSGTWTLRQQPRGVKRIVIVLQPTGTDMTSFQNLTITGPNGLDGSDNDGTGTCVGDNGKNAMTFLARINGDLTVGDFTLNLGNGGEGGSPTCTGTPDATATGGNGGNNGKAKIRTTGNFEITGSFNLNPGNGGNGGNAEAIAADGDNACPPTDGGTANATGGNGAAKKKRLTTRGVTGVSNITIGDMMAGSGGMATALGGNGGDNTCDCPPGGNGANAGDAIATGGNGNDASLTVVGAGAATIGVIIGGDGGNAEAGDSIGGKGANCAKLPGGDGGDGGDVTATGGNEGTGDDVDGAEGEATIAADGGKGGEGGDGIPAGSGGEGGTCTLDGDSDDCPDGDPGTLRNDLIVFLCLNLFEIFEGLIGENNSCTTGGGGSCPNPLDDTPLQNEAGTDTLGTVDLDLGSSGAGMGFLQTSQASAMPPHIGLQEVTVDIELVSLSLTSIDPVSVGVRATGNTFGDASACDQLRIITYQNGSSVGSIDVDINPDGNNDFQVESFFDVFTEVAVTDITNVTVQGHNSSTGDGNCILFLDFLYIIDP